MLVVRDVCRLCNSRCKKPSHYPKHVARSCSKKRSYLELVDAVDAARMLRITTEVRNADVYLCPLADHWHVSTHITFLKRRIRRS